MGELEGPLRTTRLRFALNTGSSRTSVNRRVLEALGYDPDASSVRFQMTTSSGVEIVPAVNLIRFAASDQQRFDFLVICHSLPPSASVDGLLGLDFLRGHRLMIDFPAGPIELN